MLETSYNEKIMEDASQIQKEESKLGDLEEEKKDGENDSDPGNEEKFRE